MYHSFIDNTPFNCKATKTALVQCTDHIVRSSIDPFWILFSIEIISENCYMRVKDRTCGHTNEERLETILDDLRSCNEYDPNVLMIYVSILRDDFYQKSLADKTMSKVSMLNILVNKQIFLFTLNLATRHKSSVNIDSNFIIILEQCFD